MDKMARSFECEAWSGGIKATALSLLKESGQRSDSRKQCGSGRSGPIGLSLLLQSHDKLSQQAIVVAFAWRADSVHQSAVESDNSVAYPPK
jgi:hypothetical protein